MSARDKRTTFAPNGSYGEGADNNKINPTRACDRGKKISVNRKLNNKKRTISHRQTKDSQTQSSSTMPEVGNAQKSKSIDRKTSHDSSTAKDDVNSKEMAGFVGRVTQEIDNFEEETDLDEESKRLIDNDDEDAINFHHSSQSSSDPRTPTERPKDEQNLQSSRKPSQANDLPPGWEEHIDKMGLYYWHIDSGRIQRNKPEILVVKEDDTAPVMLFFDDEEINQAVQGTSSDEDDFFESGAALTVDDSSETNFVVYPLGSCEVDETELVSANSTKAIQKCILRLSNEPPKDELVCWGLNQNQPILMRLYDDHIQFTDLTLRNLLRSQPILAIKTWAVDDDNNFAFVVEERGQDRESFATTEAEYYDSMDYSLLNAPTYVCYVFRSTDDDDMSCRVAAKLNKEFNRFKEQLSMKISKSTRLQQMTISNEIDDHTDAEEIEEIEADCETTQNVRYIGTTPVPRPNGIDVLHVAIDKCLAEATKTEPVTSDGNDSELQERLIDCKLHVSPSSVIVENTETGQIIVECRIRYLTFMGISKRDIRWCGFIMQDANNKTFSAHCFECHPTAAQVCEAIQASCTRMFEKIVKHSSHRSPETTSIIPTGSKIRDTIAKTFSKMKLNPLASG